MRILFLLAVSVCVFTGCATVDQKISLHYNQVDRSFGRHTGPVIVAMAPNKPSARNEVGETIIGAQNNANGIHKADILADKSIEEWIGEALLRELKAVGYSATISPQIPVNAQHGVLVSNILISLNINKGVASDDSKQQLKFNVDLFQKGIKIKSFTVASNDNRTIPISVSKSELEKIMLSSLQEAMLQIIPEIISVTTAK